YATCFVNYHNPGIGMAARAVLALNGVETEVVYPRCCGMPQFEQGDLAKVAESARSVSQTLLPWIEKGYDVVALVPSCALMLKFDIALKIGKPAARTAKDSGKRQVSSECPLAGAHILQGIEKQGGSAPPSAPHPIVIFARAYGACAWPARSPWPTSCPLPITPA